MLHPKHVSPIPDKSVICFPDERIKRVGVLTNFQVLEFFGLNLA
jgi:hypothetical protein